MSQRNEERTDIDRLRARARALFISQATIDDLLAWATPRQLQAVDRLLHTELDNRETSKRARLLRRARFPVPKTLDGYDFTNVVCVQCFFGGVVMLFSAVWAAGFPHDGHRSLSG